MTRVLVVGATGSIGQVVLPTLVRAGHEVVALARSVQSLSESQPPVVPVACDLSTGELPPEAVAGVDAIVMVHGAGGETKPEDVDYGAVPAVLRAVGTSRPHVVLMTSMAVTHETGSWREAMHWKRRGERLLRASGLPATVVRPGWFDLQPPEFTGVSLEQGDVTSVDSRRPVSRQQIAEVIAAAVITPAARGCTFELFAAPGEMPRDWGATFGALAHDRPGRIDAALDPTTPHVEDEPERFKSDLAVLALN